MNLSELLVSISLSSIVLGASIKFAFEVHTRINQKLVEIKEKNEVLHALYVLSRSIRNSGFPIISNSFPKITKEKSNSKIGIAVGKSSSLDTTNPGNFTYRKGVNNVNQSDALAIFHSSLGHFDCLGHRIDQKRLIKGIAYQGFFTQRADGQKGKTGMLMCQSISSSGKIQNDGILSGVNNVKFELRPNERNPNGILISLTMDSGKHYERFIALRNKVMTN